MKRFALPVLVALSLIVSTMPVSSAAVTSGTKCSKAGVKQNYKGKVFTCVKLGSKLYWNNGVKKINPSPKQTPQPEATPTPSPSVSVAPVKQCRYGSAIPKALSNVAVVWKGADLVVSYEWDYRDPNFNCPITELQVFLESKGGTKRESNPGSPGMVNPELERFALTQGTANQVLTISKEANRSIMGVFVVDIVKVCLLATDSFNNVGEYVCASEVPKYQLDLPAPVISVSPEVSGYKVSYTTPTSEMFDAIQIVEYVSSSSSEPIGVGYSATFWGNGNPANVIAQDSNSRWVKARSSSKAGIWTEFSAAIFVTPISPIRVR